MQVQVYRVQNLTTEADEFFEATNLPTDANAYNLDGKKLIDPNDRILTVDAAVALEYGIARAVVPDRQGVLDFLAKRDQVTFGALAPTLETNWSEEMVRKLNHPAVVGILTMVALLGLYMELSTPGLGLPGLVAVIAFVVLIGSKYLVGMANWIEVAVLVLGVILLLIEILVIPGFGIAGIAGILCILGGFFGMLVRNPPDRLPWPQTNLDWNLFTENLLGFAIGIVGFGIVASLLARYLPRTKLFSSLVLTPAGGTPDTTSPIPSVQALKIGAVGVTLTPLHPAGRAAFGEQYVDCVTQGEFLDQGVSVTIFKIRGNRIVVKSISGANEEVNP
jgi:membrane-bound serine protease (ClpP class)